MTKLTTDRPRKPATKKKTAVQKRATATTRGAAKKRATVTTRGATKKRAPAQKKKRPSRVGMDEARTWLMRSYGGFPVMNGRCHRYPEPHHEHRWVCLTRQALDYQRARVWCFRAGEEPPPRNSQFEYLLYHGKPEQIKRRATRNKHRAILKPNKDEEVHHHDRRRLSLSSAVVVSRRKHDEIHAED